MRYVPVFLLALVSLQLNGCIILPLPPLGAQIGREDIQTLEPGRSTREQVHEALGDPDVTVTDRYEIFEVSEESFNVLVVFIFPPGAHDVVPAYGRFYRVLVEYEPGGILHDLRWEARVGGDEVRYVSPDTESVDLSEDGSGEIPPEEQRPSLTWPEPLRGGGAISASPDGRLLAVSIPAQIWTPAIVLYDGWTGVTLAEIDAISGCKPLGIDSRGWWFDAELRARSEWSFPATTVFLADGGLLASIAAEDTLCIWNADTQMRVLELSGGHGIWGVISARSAPIVAAVDAAGSIGIWNGRSGSMINTVAPCRPKESCVELKMALSGDGQLLATLQHRWTGPNLVGSYFQQGYGVRLWDVGTGAELAAFELTKRPWYQANPHSIALSSDLQRVAVHLGGHIEIWRINKTPGPAWQERSPSKKTAWSVELERVLILPATTLTAPFVFPSVAFSADGRKLAAGYGAAMVWEVGTWREIWRAPLVNSHRESLHDGFVFTGDGRRIISECCFWEVPELDDPQHSHAAVTAMQQ